MSKTTIFNLFIFIFIMALLIVSNIYNSTMDIHMVVVIINAVLWVFTAYLCGKSDGSRNK